MGKALDLAIANIRAEFGENSIILFGENKTRYLVYKTVNLINGKIYIGQHTTKNIKDGYNGSGDLIIKAISKYGRKNFKRYLVEFCNNIEHLNEREIYWISHYKSDDLNIGYNIAPGGTLRLSEASKKKISETLKKKYEAGLLKTKLGFKHSEESKNKMSETRKAKFLSGELKVNIPTITEEFRERCRERNLGKKLSKESIEKRTKTRREKGGFIFSEEHRRKIGESNSVVLKGRKLSEETIKKRTETFKKNRELKKM